MQRSSGSSTTRPNLHVGFWLACGAAAISLDLLSTIIVIHSGVGHEGNPVAKLAIAATALLPALIGLSILKFAALCLFAAVLTYCHSNLHRCLSAIGLVLISSLTLAVALHNTLVLYQAV